MQFVQIGLKVLNMALVTDMVMEEDKVTINFVAPMLRMDMGTAYTVGRYIELRGEEADAMKQWIVENRQK